MPCPCKMLPFLVIVMLCFFFFCLKFRSFLCYLLYISVTCQLMVLVSAYHCYVISLLLTSLWLLFQLENIFTLYDVPNIWHIPRLLKVPFSQLNYWKSPRKHCSHTSNRIRRLTWLSPKCWILLGMYCIYLVMSFAFLACGGLEVISVVSETVLLKNLLWRNGLPEPNYVPTYMCRWSSAFNKLVTMTLP